MKKYCKECKHELAEAYGVSLTNYKPTKIYICRVCDATKILNKMIANNRPKIAEQQARLDKHKLNYPTK